MATNAQVAARAGVSTATVSRAINGTARVNPDTHQRVTKAARDLDYTPSAKAVALAKGERTMVAALAPVGLPDAVIGPLVTHASAVAPDVSFISVVSRPHLDVELRRLARDDRIAAVLSISMTPRPGQANWFAAGRPPLIA
ncbi:MAG: LacI family DNA-binding transcriptional regulator, partial [Acidimicrobiia bacterium]|nr:LacI family DNA-binding transcriptional regulator [Acidimicrobiia bacterium]